MCGGLLVFLLVLLFALFVAYEQRASLCSCRLRHADPRWRDFSCNWIECLLREGLSYVVHPF